MFDGKHRAHPGLAFIPQRFNPWVLRSVHGLLPWVLRFRTRRWLIGGISRVETANVEGLVNLFQQFQAGKIRLLIAFRHAEVEDPLCLLHAFSRAVPRAARRQQVALTLPVHSHFIYDRGMTLWAGDWLGWLFSRCGGIPIHRGRLLDRQALRAARELMAHGQFPLTVAPEGATNGHGEIISPLEPGVAQLGFWCVEDLIAAKRPETVLILPIGIRYRFVTPPWAKLDWLLSRLERESGLPPGQFDPDRPAASLYPRLFSLSEHLLSQMEEFYRCCYHRTFAVPDPSSDPNQALSDRLQAVLDAALQVAEEYFGLPSQGTTIDRCRRLEEAGWRAIYREDIPDWKALPPFQRGLADWRAEEAELRLKHMRLVESFVAVTGSYVKEKPTAERFGEMASILFDLMARIEGTTVPKRPRLGKRWVEVRVGDPISVTDRWPCYHRNRQASKQAVRDLLQDLQQALEGTIEEEGGW